MSSATSALSSLLSGSSSSAAAYFTGMSNYSQDLNNAISREVQIAELPIELLQNNVNDLTNQSAELQTLESDLNNVQSAVTSLASAAGSMLTATVANPYMATATVSSGATAGSYTLAVNNLGSFSNALSNDGLTTVTNPASQSVSASDSFTLTVTNGTGSPASTPITVTGGGLNGLAAAINAADAGVQAAVVNVGSSTAPDYRLSLQSQVLGPVTMQLNDGTQALVTASGAAGVLAQYVVDGKTVESDSDTITLAQGVTVQLTGTDSTASTVTVAGDASGIGSALQSLVSAYNSAMTELDNNRGQTDVALAGQSIVYQLTNDLQSLANYSAGSGSISSLSALGVTFSDTTGQLSFDQDTFDSATNGQADALQQFLGSATGGGFLQMATNSLTGVVDSNKGVVPQAIATLQTQITNANTQITAKDAAVTLMQQNLTQQMAAADTMIYDLQQQATEMQEMFTAQQATEMQSATL